MSIYERQQARKRAEKWYGPWEQTRAAILEAHGARECADVAQEQADAQQAKAEWEAQRNMTPEQYGVYIANPSTITIINDSTTKRGFISK